MQNLWAALICRLQRSERWWWWRKGNIFGIPIAGSSGESCHISLPAHHHHYHHQLEHSHYHHLYTLRLFSPCQEAHCQPREKAEGRVVGRENVPSHKTDLHHIHPPKLHIYQIKHHTSQEACHHRQTYHHTRPRPTRITIQNTQLFIKIMCTRRQWYAFR